MPCDTSGTVSHTKSVSTCDSGSISLMRRLLKCEEKSSEPSETTTSRLFVAELCALHRGTNGPPTAYYAVNLALPLASFQKSRGYANQIVDSVNRGSLTTNSRKTPSRGFFALHCHRSFRKSKQPCRISCSLVSLSLPPTFGYPP